MLRDTSLTRFNAHYFSVERMGNFTPFQIQSPKIPRGRKLTTWGTFSIGKYLRDIGKRTIIVFFMINDPYFQRGTLGWVGKK